MVDQKAFIATGGKEANVLVGTDYGKSWKKYKTPIIQGEKMTGIFSVNNLSVDTAIIAGGDWSAKQKIENTMAITKIITLIPSATEIISFLGLGSQLVGVSHECDFPKKVKNLKKLTKTDIKTKATSYDIHLQIEKILEKEKD